MCALDVVLDAQMGGRQWAGASGRAFATLASQLEARARWLCVASFAARADPQHHRV